MIERLKEPEQIVQHLFTFEDDIEDHIRITRGEWLQWLIQSTANENILIIRSTNEQQETTGYLVLANQVRPPLLRHTYVLYCYSKDDLQVHEEALQKIKEWSKEKRASYIRFMTKTPKAFYKYGFKETGAVAMEMEI
jgi:hypothetical protein